MPLTFVLVHSPIVGPDTWQPTAELLRRRGHAAVVPELVDDGSPPFWEQHVAAVVAEVEAATQPDYALVIAAHSGAGQLLAHIAVSCNGTGRDVAALLLVDAGLPPEDTSRFDQLRQEAPAFAAELEALFDAGEAFPDWSDAQLSALVPDAARRRALVGGIRQQPRSYWEEVIPAVPGWAQAPCAALLLSDGYETTAAAARARGWPLRRLDVDNHFAMLADPDAVADELVELVVALEAAP